MNTKRTYIILALLLGCVPSVVTAANSDKAAAFFYRIGKWVDNFQLRGLDTTYIALPEHSWRVALTTGGTGIHATYTTWADAATPIAFNSHTTPSLELGFNAGYRGYGGGYSMKSFKEIGNWCLIQLKVLVDWKERYRQNRRIILYETNVQMDSADFGVGDTQLQRLQTRTGCTGGSEHGR